MLLLLQLLLPPFVLDTVTALYHGNLCHNQCKERGYFRRISFRLLLPSSPRATVYTVSWSVPSLNVSLLPSFALSFSSVELMPIFFHGVSPLGEGSFPIPDSTHFPRQTNQIKEIKSYHKYTVTKRQSRTSNHHEEEEIVSHKGVWDFVPIAAYAITLVNGDYNMEAWERLS
jgi:hypothetical protein